MRVSRVRFFIEGDLRAWTISRDCGQGVSIHVGPNDDGFFRPRNDRWAVGPVLRDIPRKDAWMDDEAWAVKAKLVPWPATQRR